ncbi:hypothetical protein H0H92_000728 [Tricholoma furcatifolium]|nr:hypothetical protein H0H92_000728 [Tricholoma furcatifolium]
MPFAGFKRNAKEWRKYALDIINSAKRSILVRTPYVASLPFASSFDWSEWTVSATLSCILGLLSNPAAFQNAREEIDRVVGTNPLPNFDDFDSLPYSTAITMETLRWRDVTPIGMIFPSRFPISANRRTAVPHLHEEDEFKGYRISKGSIVIPNAWLVPRMTVPMFMGT